MNRIPSEILSCKSPAITIKKNLAFLKNYFQGYRFMQWQAIKQGNLTTTKGGEKGTVIEQITEKEKYQMILIRRMEVKQ